MTLSPLPKELKRVTNERRFAATKSSQLSSGQNEGSAYAKVCGGLRTNGFAGRIQH